MDALQQTSSDACINSNVSWCAHARTVNTALWRTLASLIGLALLILAALLIFALNRGITRHGGLLSIVMTPMFLEGYAGFGMALNAFLVSAKSMRGLRLERTGDRINLMSRSTPAWSGQLNSIEMVALVASRELGARIIRRMILIQTNADTNTTGFMWRPALDDHDPPFLGASTRSILFPAVFDVSGIDLASRIAEGAGLSICEIESGVPNGLRVVRAWSRSPDHSTLHDEPPILQRWRMFTGVCTACRHQLPVLRWFMVTNQRECPQCKTSIRRHPARIPVAITSALASSLILAALNKWLLIARVPNLYLGTFIVLQMTFLYCLSRMWSRYSVISESGIHCRECGYDLRACTDGRCSECGTPTAENANSAPPIARPDR